MRQKVLITSALPYSNGPLHFGHIAGAYLPADAYARFERLKGKEVLYICGSDQYGVAITLSAELAGRTPKQQSSFFHRVNTDLFEKLGFSFDHFSKTTCSEHAPLVTQFFLDLMKNGHIEERETEQLFSETENRFLADRYVVGTCPKCGYEKARGDECGKCGASYEATDLKNPRSKLTGSPLTSRKTSHYYLLFDHFKEQLTNFLKTKGWKSNTMHFASSYIKEIRARAITRDLKWGVPVPDKGEDKVFYVWFDAPIGYISATQEWANKKGDPELWKQYWCNPQTKYIQFIGKDNIPFHAIFFPAMIMGQNQPYKLVDELVANEFLNLEGKQFSKSDGAIIDLAEFFENFDADQIRYTLAANAPETADSEFSWKDFEMRCNVELVGKLGNLVNRVLVFAQNNTQAIVPAQGELQDVDSRFVDEMSRLVKEIEESYASFRLRRVTTLMMELSSACNAYFDVKTPWKDAKQEASRPFMETTINLCLECIKLLALVSSPIIPHSAQKIWQMLGSKAVLDEMSWEEVVKTPLEVGAKLPKPQILFKKVEGIP